MKLKPITSIEKQFGKKAVAEALSDVIIKPAGKPSLVSEDDKRPALGTEDAVNDFK
jgi:phage protein